MKNLTIIFITSVILWGCSGSMDTSNLSSEERLSYAMMKYNQETYDEAIAEYQAILLQFPGNPVVDDAQFYLAQSRFKREEYILAAYEFSRLIQSMPASEFVPESQYMLAECYYRLSPDYTLDQTYSVKAIQEYQAFIDFFPADKRVSEAEGKIKEMNDKLARKVYNAAYIYEKMDYYTAAIIYYGKVVELHHDTHYAPMAMFDKIRLLISRERNPEALKEIDRFIERYPDNIRAPEVERMKQSLQSRLSASGK